MDTKLKKSLVLQNNYICKFGYLQNKSSYTSYKNQLNENYNVGLPITFCDVYILKIHPLIIAKQFVNLNMNPVILNLVNEKYTMNNIENLEGVYDEILNLRTNFQCISKQNNNFPPKENEVNYTPQVIVMRDETLNPSPNIFKVSFITLTCKPESYTILKYLETDSDSEELETENSSLEQKLKKICSVDTYLNLKSKVELVFQTAHYGGNRVLILNDFGCVHDNIPIDDIIDIMNSCILKYGHLFKEIIFALNSRTHEEIEVYDQMLKNIIKPQDIINKDDNMEDINQDTLLANIIMRTA
jgi:hypothetical protein